MSLRQQMEKHRTNTICASCHARMDPLGFGLENFDAIGRWRDKDGAFPVDPSGTLPDGKTFNGPDQLKEILVANRDAFTQGMAEKMMIYALGRGLEPADRPAVRAIAQQVAQNRYRISSDGARHRQQRTVSTKKRRPEFAMIVTRKHLPRRTFLRGIGASLALPDTGLHDAGLRRTRGQGARTPALHLHSRGRQHDFVDARGHGPRL